jgi:hypothetical protein
MQPPSFPISLQEYADPAGAGLAAILWARVQREPFNAVATGIFLAAVTHTFMVHRFRDWADRAQARADRQADAQGRPRMPTFTAGMLHFLGEVEVVFGMWAIVLIAAIAMRFGWDTATAYVRDGVVFNEAIFVVVIMAMAATRPVVGFAEAVMRRGASLGGQSPAAWWFTILTIGPLLGSLITEPAAMTLSAILLSRQFYDLNPSNRLKYATLGLLFVNVSIGGTLTHFAAPPVLMVARPWDWSLGYMLGHFGWKAAIAILVANTVHLLIFRNDLRALAAIRPVPDEDLAGPGLPVPPWVVAVHIGFLIFAVMESHHPVLFVGAFMFFLGFLDVTRPYQSVMDLKAPILVGFFLAGLVVHGGLQGWWIAPTLGRLSEIPLFTGATILTAFNDNALITYLATLVPDFSEPLKYAVVAGAVTGGGLTVIANAPNPAGQAILGRFFDGGVSPLGLMAGALVPTLIAAAGFMLL